MPPKSFNPERAMKMKPVSLSPKTTTKISSIKDLQSEIEKIRSDNEQIAKQIEQYEKESLDMIAEYRLKIDMKTTTMNAHKKKSEVLRGETENKKKDLIAQNEKEKKKIRDENDEISRKIVDSEKSLQTINEFEKNKMQISEKIHNLESDIEKLKRNTEDEIEEIIKETAAVEARANELNKIRLEEKKNEQYIAEINSDDQAKLMHIQRRFNLESDLQSLKQMQSKYEVKIKERENHNAKLRETIEQLKHTQLITDSAEQSRQITALQKELQQARSQLKQSSEKSKQERQEAEKKRNEEAKKMELGLKHQQDLLDHKLQQIAALRELCFTVLSYRSQLEAEFITVLGEVIYEVAQRENPDAVLSQSRATRKLSMTSSSASSAEGSVRAPIKGKEISINHTLALFTMEDRITVLQRFIDRVQGTVDQKTGREMTPTLNLDVEENPEQ